MKYLPTVTLIVAVAFVVCLTTPQPASGAIFAGAGHDQLYTDLGVRKEATKAEIRKAFRALTREHHPDLQDTLEGKEASKGVMARLLRAYEVLADDEKRRDYDESGFIPGEAPDPKDYTAQEIFEYFHQRAPIFSKTPTLESVAVLKRIQNFRGQKLFLIEVYDDACAGCKVFSGAWETFRHSALVDAGIIEMYRIDGKSPEGVELLKVLGIRYSSEPIVFAIIDGEKWTLYGTDEAVKKKKSERMCFQALMEFAMGFFWDEYETIGSMSETSSSHELLDYLRASRTPDAPVRILFPKLTAESVPLAIQLRYGSQAVVRSVSREALMSLIEQHCDLTVDVRDRRGDQVPMPEVMLVSLQSLPGSVYEGAEGEDEDEDVHTCGGVHIGSSVALTYDKAAQFANNVMPSLHPGVEKLPFLNAMNFHDVCRQNCLMWIRPSCSQPAEADMVALLQRDYMSFKTGYMCVDEQPQLATRFSVDSDSFAPVLAAITDSDDSILFRFTSIEKGKTTSSVKPKDIEAIFAELVDEEKRASGQVSGVTVDRGAALSTLLPSKRFRLESKQWWYLFAMEVHNRFAPMLLNVLPFIMMYFLHTKVLNKWKDNDSANNNNASSTNGTDTTGPASQTTAPRPTTTRTAPSSAAKKSTPAPPPKNEVRALNGEDIKAAQSGKGFLIVISDQRDAAHSAEPMKLPLVALDDRFTVRLLSPSDTQWKEWITAQTAQEEGTNAYSGPAEEKGLRVLAIRKQRMKVAVKPPQQSVDGFLRDLLDGTVMAQQDLPEWWSDTP